MPLDAQTRLLRVIDGSEPALNPKTSRRHQRADHRGDQPRPARSDPAGAVPRGTCSSASTSRRCACRRSATGWTTSRTSPAPSWLRANREGLPSKTIDAAALDRLKQHPWPGNVRELENLIRRICALYGEDLITARIVERELADQQPTVNGEEGPATLAQLVERKLSSYFADQPDGLPPAGLYDRVLEEVERPLIQLTLSATRGNQVRAAEIPRPQPQHPAQEDPGSRGGDAARPALTPRCRFLATSLLSLGHSPLDLTCPCRCFPNSSSTACAAHALAGPAVPRRPRRGLRGRRRADGPGDPARRVTAADRAAWARPAN